MPVSITTNIPGTIREKLPPIMVDTPKAFRLVLDNAARGQVIIYYSGDLAYDRDYGKEEYREPIRRLADAAMAAAEIGRVHLFQKRLGPYEYEYQAHVRGRRRA